MSVRYQITHETPEAIYELILSVKAKDSEHIITQMPSGDALALAKALKIKNNGNMNAVWSELDKLSTEILGYPLSPKYREANIGF